jgi:Tol biopolymer transport system component
VKRFAVLALLLVLAVAVGACSPAVAPTATPVFVPLPTQEAGRPQSGPPVTIGVPTSAPGAPVVTAQDPTRTPAPTPTSIAAKYFVTPSATPPPATPTPRPALRGRLVYQTASGGDINVINLDGSGMRTVAHGLDPAWSPDGKQIAFTKWVDGPGLYVVNPDGTGERQLYAMHDAKSPAWSPDGTMIAVTTRDSMVATVTFGRYSYSTTKDQWKLLAVPVAGGDLIPVPVDFEYYAFSPTWSSTGFIAYHGNRGLYVTTMKKDAQASLVGNTPRPDSPVWSPDGSRLAFMMWQNDRWDIFVMNPDGSYLKILTPPPPYLKRPYNNVAPAWSPDGKYIAFLSDREGMDNWRTYVMNADGSDQRPLLDVTVRYEAASERVLSWSR